MTEVLIRARRGKATVYIGDADEPLPVDGDVGLEGPWVHVKADGVERTFPVVRVVEIAWHERRQP